MVTKAGRRRRSNFTPKLKPKPEVKVEVKPEVKVEVKPVKIKAKKIGVFMAVYTGTARNIRISGVGRIHPGKEFEVSEKIAKSLRLDDSFKVRLSYKEVEV